MSLALFPTSTLPPARANLLSLNERIAAAERQLDRLADGRDRLQRELSKAGAAREELQRLVDADAKDLLSKLRAGGSWLLSQCGSHKARELAGTLSVSRIEASIGERALADVETEIAELERSIADMKAAKADAIRAVLLEVAGSFREEWHDAVEQARALVAILTGLNRLVTVDTGEWRPESTDRVVIEIPPIGGAAESVVVVPAAAISTARAVWSKFAEAIDKDALSSVDLLQFSPIDADADKDKVIYSNLSAPERRKLDQQFASGIIN